MVVVVRRRRWARWLALAAVVMFPLLGAHFWWEGWHGSPAVENAVVARMARDPALSVGERTWLRRWPGFLAATNAARERANALAIGVGAKGWIYVQTVEAQQKTALVMPAFGTFALLLCAWLWLARVRATDAGMWPPWSRLVPWSSVLEIDVRRWQAEGIVRLVFARNPGGATGGLVLSSRSWEGIAGLLALADRHAAKARVVLPDSLGAER